MSLRHLLLPLVPLAVAVTVVASPLAAQRSQSASLTAGVVDINTTLGLEGGAAAGTGVVLPAGMVLTNNHVIRGATAIRVVVPASGHSYRATVVGYSVANDIAVLKLNAAGLKTVTTANSSTVRVGQPVTAVGNAGGVGGKPTTARGKITGIGRTITASDGGISEQLKGLIRTDAALQPGDSGGPLLNAAGQVIGIDTAASVAFALSGTSGDGFAIPINKALSIARQIIGGHASATVHVGSTPFLGLSVATQTDVSSGVVVSSVVGGGPADRAGIAAGEVITSVNGKPVASFTQLTTALLRHNAGATVSIGILDLTGTAATVPVHTSAGPPQ
jgi:S1-C subfamily serine protease